ncbi:MAG: DUF1254 domain-containing protein [Sulfurovum sp.]|nr:DUF1254 domain-containing protein [Sulfurovaceae bacterium]
MRKKFKVAAYTLCVIYGLSNMAYASGGDQNGLEIYAPHQAPDNMTMTEKALHRRAIEIAIWAQPLMNYKAIYDSLHKAVGMNYNGDVVYHGEIQNWKRAIPTSNNTTQYINFFWDLHQGPVVVKIPASENGVILYGTLLNSWHGAIEDYGEGGEDHGLGAKYLMIPPNYKGYIPESGYIVFQQKTYFGFTFLRTIVKDKTKETLQKAIDLVKKIEVYPFSEAANPKSTNHIDLTGKDIDGIVKFDAGLYKNLHEILEQEYLEDKDLAMMGMLEAMDISKGQPYKTNARRDAILDDAAKDAHEYMAFLFHNGDMIPPYYKGKQWTNALPPTLHGFDFEYASHLDYNRRGSLYYAIFSSIKHLGATSFYLNVAKDKAGNWLDGSKSYKLTVPANVPADMFWALTAYDMKTAAFIRNVPSAGVSSLDKGFEVNKDGTVDVYIGPKAPKGKEVNWVPTKEGHKFFMMARFYGPRDAVFTKKWQFDDVELMK